MILVKKTNIVIVIFCSLITYYHAQVDTIQVERTTLVKEVVVKGEAIISNGQFISHQNDAQRKIDEILARTPGVTLIKRGNYAQEPTIRGLNAGQISTTIDGMQMFGACTDRMDPISSYVETNNLESVELSFGPNDDQFGAGIGGGFNFKLTKPKLNSKKFFSGSIGSGYETNGNAIRGIARVQLSKQKWAIQANSIYRKSDNYIAGRNREVEFSQFEKWNFGTSAIVQVAKQHTVSVDYLQDDARNVGYPALLMDVAFANAKIASISHNYSNKKRKLYEADSKVYFNFIDHAMDDTKRPKEDVPMHMDMPGTSQTAGFYSHFSMRIGGKHFVKAKLNGFVNDLHAEMTMYPENLSEMFMLTIPDARRMLIGLDLNDNFILNAKTKFIVGLRGDYGRSAIITNIGRKTLSSIYLEPLTKYMLVFNGFLQVNHKVGKNMSLSGGLARGSRLPTLQELYGFYLFNRLDNFDYLGNPDLLTENSWNINVEYSLSKKKVGLTSKLFGYFFENYIAGIKRSDYSAMTIGATGVKEYQNIEGATIFGGELIFKYALSKNLQFNSDNSITYGLDNSNKALPLIPPFKSSNTLMFSWRKILVSGVYTYGGNQNHVDFEKYGETPSNGYNTFSLGVSRKFEFKSSSLFLRLDIHNMFDAAYSEHLDFMSINRQGKNFELSLTYTIN